MQALRTTVHADAWQPNIPFGMHPMSQGMAYAEFNQESVSSSFGEDRSDILVKSLIHSLENNLELKDAIRAVLSKRGYLASNPALIER